VAAWAVREVVGEERAKLEVEIAQRARPRLVMRECCTVEQHDAIKADPNQWAAQRFIGIMDACAGDGTVLVLRNCECQGTMAQRVAVAVMPGRGDAL
jgi:hypothetical protein